MHLNRRFAQFSRRKRAVCLCVLPFAAFGILYALKILYENTLMQHMPPCFLRTLTGWLCPSCGMTHAVFALTRLDLVTALRENLMIPLIALFSLLWYLEQWIALSDKPRRLLPRSGKFWIGILIFWLIYTILRNLLPTV